MAGAFDRTISTGDLLSDRLLDKGVMSEKCTVLMYHAVPAHSGENGGADQHYSVDRRAFKAHLDMLDSLSLCAKAVDAIWGESARHPAVGMTFDDGHVTNRWAAEELAGRGWSGTFFVNPSTVGTRNFLSWADLCAMADAGMSIQSHSFNHRYIDELSAHDVAQELSSSKKAIEDHVGRPVGVFAPPGGRLSRNLKAVAMAAGYSMVCTSRVGVWNVDNGSAWDVPRFAVLSSTPLSQLANWAQRTPSEIARQVVRHRALGVVKGVLGNAGYERFRNALLSTSKGS